MTAGKALYLLNRLAPDDLGLPYEQSTFVVRDERTGKPLPIVAWWIPCESAGAPETGRCAVLIHGYADAKVGAIAWAPLWHALGYHLLVPDLAPTARAAADLPPPVFLNGMTWRGPQEVEPPGQNRLERSCCSVQAWARRLPPRRPHRWSRETFPPSFLKARF